MGSRGPVPKRSDLRRGHASRSAAETVVTRLPGAPAVEVPEPDAEWDPIARMIWDGACESGQARFYEPSDYALLYSLMDDLTYYKRQSRRSSEMLASIMSGLSSLLVTEGDRRRVRVELTREPVAGERSAGVVEMERWRAQFGDSTSTV